MMAATAPMVLVLALRGAAAVGVLVALIGGLPRLGQAGLAGAVGVWSAVVAAELAPLPSEVGAALGLIAARELVVGATIGLVAALPLLGVAMAGRLVDGSHGARARGPYSSLFSVL